MNSIFITGASSGIGEHLSYFYAKKGATLGLSARRIDELKKVASKCEAIGAKVFYYQLDVNEQQKISDAIKDFASKVETLDCVIANAGIGLNENITSGNASKVNQVLTTNLLGVTNTLIPAIPFMKKQNFGKLVAISSVASYIPTPNNSGYSASKAGVRMLMNGFRLKLTQFNIKCITICPGFVDTPLLVDKRNSNFLMLPVEDGVKKIANAIERNRKTFIFPWHYHFLLPIIKILPEWILIKLIKS